MLNFQAPASARAEPKQIRVHAVLWNSLGRGSVAYTANELLENMPRSLVDAKLWCLSRDPEFHRDFHHPALPHILFRTFCKAHVPAHVQGRLATEVALRSVKPGDIVYMWPPYDLRMIRGARDRGAIIVAERINCMSELVRDVLTPAYARIGLSLPDGWCTPKMIAEEREQMMKCDFLTAPNAFVAESIVKAGISADRILETSYGFNPKRLAKAIGISRPARPPVFAFVGLGIIRKGFDVVLEAWEQANVGGNLLIAGYVDEYLRRRYKDTLARPDVHELGYVEDIASIYAQADVFVFPTQEEGGPQVTYEAAACGLPSIVSPMGATRVVRDGVEGIIVDPLDVASVAGALRALADDPDLRCRLGQNAATRAREFSWDKVGNRLYELFRNVTKNSFHAAAADRRTS